MTDEEILKIIIQAQIEEIKKLSDPEGTWKVTTTLEEFLLSIDQPKPIIVEQNFVGKTGVKNTLKWKSNLNSYKFVKNAIINGVDNLDQLSEAAYEGWRETVKEFISNPSEFAIVKTQQNGKLDRALERLREMYNIQWNQPEDTWHQKKLCRAIAKVASIID